jgi:6-phosphogluconolactonase (cycloisomerase 2 family)
MVSTHDPSREFAELTYRGIEQYLYVNSELQSELLIYSTVSRALLSRTDVTPSHLSPEEKAKLLTAEMYLHPRQIRTLYISNRGILRLSTSQSTESQKGDSITIVLLSQDGSFVQSIHHLETGLDWPRGMRISDDGRYLAVAGEYGGGVEVYSIRGDRGEELKLVAKDEGVRDVNCVLWL